MAKKSKKKANATAPKPIKTVSKPVTVGSVVTKKAAPKMRMSDRSVRISHMEYVRDISTGTGDAEALRVNPQSSAVFPWLSAIATRYEMYRFHKLKFHYKPSCPTTSSGYIVLGFDFEVTDPTPTKAVMLTWRYSAKSPLWEGVTLDVSPDARLSTFRYNQDYRVQYSTNDTRLDFLGSLFVLPYAATTFLGGELFVEYDVELIQPAYRLPMVLSQSIYGSDMTTAAGYNIPGQLKNSTGNLDFVAVDSNTFDIYSIGSFSMELFQAWASAAASFTLSAAGPSSKWSTFPVRNSSVLTQSAVGSSYAIGVQLDVGPLRVTLVPPTGVTGATPWNFRLSTALK